MYMMTNAERGEFRDPKQVTCYQCQNCGQVFWRELDAMRCDCIERDGWRWVCSECGKEVPRFWHKCSECELDERRGNAKHHYPIDEYDGPIYYGDEFYDDYENLVDCLEADGDSFEESFAFGTIWFDVKLDPHEIVDQFEQEADFDGYDGMPVEARDEIAKFCEEWNGRWAEKRYTVDYSIALDAPKEGVDSR